VAPEIKFCGLTRAEDAAYAAALGARYGGVIFAGGPRERPPAEAAAVLDAAPQLRRVGVIGGQSRREIDALIRAVRLDVLQMHAESDPAVIAVLRRETGREVWGVLRLDGTICPPHASELFAVADAVLVEPRVAGALGGTGVALHWGAVATELAARRGAARVVLAGGLTPTNVQEAVGAMAPAVVDVSSGVEVAPGLKDHHKMQAFAEAVLV
jgi:phosphoribosylanthranilate isomerase